MKSRAKKVDLASSASDELSDAEMARFLHSLGQSLRDKRTGNPALSRGLLRVARSLSISGEREARAQAENGQQPLRLAPATTEMQGFDPKQVRDFISDTGRTKEELIELAGARFSIPRSKLQKMNIAAVRDAVAAALTHEDSLTAISEEAAKQGFQRQS